MFIIVYSHSYSNEIRGKKVKLIKISLFVLKGQIHSLGSGKGLVPNRCEAIISTTNDPVHRHIDTRALIQYKNDILPV